jgi:hypothetical protein
MSGIVGRSSIGSTDLNRGLARAGGRPDGALPRPATRTLHRLSVRLRRRGLDRQLAAGVNPDTSPDLELRAWQLVQHASRRRVARGLRRAVREAQSHRLNEPSSVVGIPRQAVTQWSQGLLDIADAIDQSDCVSACGIALALELLTDGTGPLYDPGAEDLLGAAVWWSAKSLHT